MTKVIIKVPKSAVSAILMEAFSPLGQRGIWSAGHGSPSTWCLSAATVAEGVLTASGGVDRGNRCLDPSVRRAQKQVSKQTDDKTFSARRQK